MEDLNFYIVDADYVKYLHSAETEHRGFSRVPYIDYDENQKKKFFCGIVLRVNELDYFVPVSSYKEQQQDNFLIYSGSGRPVSSLRFNYMFPVPPTLISERRISDEPDVKYRSLLAQELRFCINNQETIRKLAARTYNRVLLGKNPGLVRHSCDFLLLESCCLEYMKAHNLQYESVNAPSATSPEKKRSLQE